MQLCTPISSPLIALLRKSGWSPAASLDKTRYHADSRSQLFGPTAGKLLALQPDQPAHTAMAKAVFCHALSIDDVRS